MRAVIAALLSVAVSASAFAQMERIALTTCAVADSLIGPIGGDAKGFVFRMHRGTPDTTIYRTGEVLLRNNEPHFRFMIATDLVIPGLMPDAEAFVTLRGRVAASILRAPAEPKVAIRLDDAPYRPMPIVQRGTFIGDAGVNLSLPISVGFLSADLLAIARAKRVAVKIDDYEVKFSADDRRDVRALVRANLCESPTDVELLESVQGSRRADSSQSRQVFFEFQVDLPVRGTRGMVGPRYPEDMRASHMEGEVMVGYVVDALGRPDIATIKVLKSTHPSFLKAIIAFLSEARFQPAVKDGKPVRQYVQQPFNFTLTR